MGTKHSHCGYKKHSRYGDKSLGIRPRFRILNSALLKALTVFSCDSLWAWKIALMQHELLNILCALRTGVGTNSRYSPPTPRVV